MGVRPTTPTELGDKFSKLRAAINELDEVLQMKPAETPAQPEIPDLWPEDLIPF